MRLTQDPEYMMQEKPSFAQLLALAVISGIVAVALGCEAVAKQVRRWL